MADTTKAQEGSARRRRRRLVGRDRLLQADAARRHGRLDHVRRRPRPGADDRAEPQGVGPVSTALAPAAPTAFGSDDPAPPRRADRLRPPAAGRRPAPGRRDPQPRRRRGPRPPGRDAGRDGAPLHAGARPRPPAHRRPAAASTSRRTTVTLDALAQLLGPHEALAAKGRSAELRGLLAEVQREHVVNRALMRQELAFLSHLTRQLGVDGEDVGYRPPSSRAPRCARPSTRPPSRCGSAAPWISRPRP